MEVKINQYQFEKICDQMKKDFGVIKKGEEENHSMMLFTMEGNLLKTQRANLSLNSRRILEAIPLVLFRIKSYLTGEEYNLTNFQTIDNLKFVDALLMAFNPFTNEELKTVIEQEKIIELTDQYQLKEFYKEPIICMLRIKESVEMWEKRMGANGYFSFTESYMGSLVPKDEELKYTIVFGENHKEI